MSNKKIKLPLTDRVIEQVKSGDSLLLSGIMYVARDAAHKRMIEALDRGDTLPFDVNGQTIYYMGPSPAKPGHAVGSSGPTTASRMDRYTPRLLELGLKGMIGKGSRSQPVKDAIKEHHAVYFAAVGGIGALISSHILTSEIIAYADLGAEAVLRLEVKDFPVTVINDSRGGDLYLEGRARYCAASGS